MEKVILPWLPVFLWMIMMLYAISDEIHQLFVPGRSGQVKDIIIDSAVAVVGIGIFQNIWVLI